jgi:hypothetical protein
MNIKTRITPDNMTTLVRGHIFVFGSNLGGRHGKGAALTARRLFGAEWGQANGIQGKSYAIPTCGHNLEPLPLDRILPYVSLFLGFAMANPGRQFKVTEIGCGLAGYQPADIAPLFIASGHISTPADIPENISLPLRFWEAMGVRP